MSGVVTVSITRKELYERVWAESVAHVGPDGDFGRWVSWARAQADRLDPLMQPPASAATDQENDETGEDDGDHSVRLA